MHATCGESLNFWLALCKDILASSPNQEIVRSTIVISDSKNSGKVLSDEHGVVKSTSASSISTGNGGGAVTTSATSKDDGDLVFSSAFLIARVYSVKAENRGKVKKLSIFCYLY